MSSSVPRKRIRKSPAQRRAEIVESAASVALNEGLEGITLRRIGEQLDVRPGLISHYFPAVEELVAEAFSSAATGELDTLLPIAGEQDPDSPVRRLSRFFADATGDSYHAVSKLWINARHLSRYRPVLRERVAAQEAAWRERLAGLIQEGVARGEFRTGDPYVSAIRIIVVIDGLAAHANTGNASHPPAVSRMAITTAETELGLREGELDPPADD
ncbi:TetR family transcriptional regulator [Streptomyces triticagri]|uniref:TetR family transcriptional regulator n=1 Tax=Streptomyces triticagri TaxID=2293568 RepID=A0A372M568_9ACTN|nr:TetR family transcriptional regulator [Streptomyces triticagri]